ncbi:MULTISPECIES: sensor domain-containing diguanylate cyclase [Giesbergeria]|uniref:diguanylate cyclase n=1 Tax=Giesbergeria sinuosa TaxID=80883 RepID=A0ABV9QCJ0_9BURK
MGVIELQIAQNWLNSLSLSPGDSVALLDESRTILARHPQIPKVSDNHIANFQIPAVLHAPTAEASNVAQSDIDGHERLLGFSKTGNFPLIVAYGIDQSRMLEQWQWRTIELTVGYFFLLLLAGISARHQWTILRQKEELHSSEEHFRMLAENMADIVWRTDALLNFTYINRADQQTRGFSREEVIGTAVQESLTPQGQAILDTKLKDRRAIKMAAPPCVAFQYELPMRHKNGGQVWIEVSSVPIYGSDGNIKGYQGIGRDISERKRHEAQLLQSQQQLENQLHQAAQEKTALQELATRDPLTGLYNRRYLDATFLRELARSRREEQPLAVVMLDLDHFKQVNDQYGHAAGDEVLKALAQLLRQGARESDLIARYGGEEFVAIMPNMSAQQAWERVQSWRTQLEAMPIVFANLHIRVTLSAGIAIFPDHGQSPSQLLTRADEMLYQSKLAGRNQITLAALEPHGPLVDGSANPA